MSVFTTFFALNNGKKVEVTDPTNYAQCFDLAVAWTDHLRIPRVWPYLYAHQIYSNFGPVQAVFYTRIPNGPDDIPKEGDIVVWGPKYNGGAGHVGVCTNSAGLWNLDVFVQNDPVYSPAHLRKYNYDNILGWLRPKISTPNADEYVKRLSDAILSAKNAIDTGEQVKDPMWKEKNKGNKASLLTLASRL